MQQRPAIFSPLMKPAEHAAHNRSQPEEGTWFVYRKLLCVSVAVATQKAYTTGARSIVEASLRSAVRPSVTGMPCSDASRHGGASAVDARTDFSPFCSYVFPPPSFRLPFSPLPSSSLTHLPGAIVLCLHHTSPPRFPAFKSLSHMPGGHAHRFRPNKRGRGINGRPYAEETKVNNLTTSAMLLYHPLRRRTACK